MATEGDGGAAAVEIEAGAAGGAGTGEGDGGAGAAAASGEGASGGGDGAAAAGKAGGDAPWYGALSDDAEDGALSDKAWMENKGYSDPAALVKAIRSLETKVGAKPIEAPGEDATPEQVAAYRKAIGVPEAADGYAFDIPAGWEADMAMFQPLREAALAGGMPATAWATLTDAFKTKIIDDHNAMVDSHNAERDGVFREWGAAKDENVTLFQRGMAEFAFKPDEVQAMQMALGKGGTERLYKLGVKLGQMTGEDRLAAPLDHKPSGLSLASAKSQLAELEKDRPFFEKLRAKDPAAVSKHNRLVEFIAAEEDRQRRANAA